MVVEPFEPGHEGLRRLAVVLRRPLPFWFIWDFAVISKDMPGRVCGCALTLARTIWPEFRAISASEPDVPRQMRAERLAFNMQKKDFTAIFGTNLGDWEHWAYGKKSAGDVSPTDVAEAIDSYLRAA